MRTLNLGILAHVDAGKTTLTERLLYAAGVIGRVGSVDDGSTQTDTLELERQRGITIRSAVVSFVLDDTTINLIDTPGHPDFIAEVERVLSVLDGAVLVISAVEGVQAQTRILMRALQRLGIPTLVFVNKIDRSGAQYDGVLEEIASRLTPAIIPMGSTYDAGSRNAGFKCFDSRDDRFTSRLIDVLAELDEALLADFVNDDSTASYSRLRTELSTKTTRALVHPIFFGSAMTGAGVDALIAGIKELLPATVGDTDGPLSGTVFKIDRGPAGEKIAYIRLSSGTVRVRDRVRFGRDSEARVTSISVFDRGAVHQRSSIVAGQIGTLRGLGEVRIGDVIGETQGSKDRQHFSPPTLETIVVPCHESDRGSLYTALAQLADQDPLINLRRDDHRQELLVSLYGEVQKEIIQATLVSDFGIEVTFSETTTICVERPIGTGASFEIIDKEPNPFLATVGLRVEAAPADSGVTFRLATEVLGTMPHAFFNAVEETVYETLRQGLYGWEVTDCTVTMTHTGYYPRQSAAHQGFDKSSSSTGWDFRSLTPLVLMTALRRASTRVHEPVHRFQLEIPADTFGSLLPVLAQCRAVQDAPEARGATYLLEGSIPAAQVHGLRQRLPMLTRGEGVLESWFDRYEPVRGSAPTRPRSDNNPLNRKEYLLHVMRRV